MIRHNLMFQTFIMADIRIARFNNSQIDLVISDKGRLIINNLEIENIPKPLVQI